MSASRKRRIRTALIATASAGVLAGGSLAAARVAGAATINANCPATAAVTSILIYNSDHVRVHEDNDIVGVPDIYGSTGGHDRYRNLDGSDGQPGIRLSAQSASSCRYDYAIFAVGAHGGSSGQQFTGIIGSIIGIRPPG
jgi:hypothetical protein